MDRKSIWYVPRGKKPRMFKERVLCNETHTSLARTHAHTYIYI